MEYFGIKVGFFLERGKGYTEVHRVGEWLRGYVVTWLSN